MPLIETVKQMQEQGIQDNEIIQRLKEEGHNMKDIDDALNQSRIKSAVYEDSSQPEANQEMQQSMMTQEIPQQDLSQMPQYPQYQQYPQETYYPQQTSPASNEMISEIAEQIVSEKTSEMKKIILSMSDFKAIVEARVSNIDERLKRIESIIDKLQMSILNKVGSYGQTIQDLKQELEATQDSFSKLINPIMDNAREKRGRNENSEPSSPKIKPERAGKNKPGFEDFLR